LVDSHPDDGLDRDGEHAVPVEALTSRPLEALAIHHPGPHDDHRVVKRLLPADGQRLHNGRTLEASTVELNQKAACKAVVVTALNDRARSWWKRLGFEPFGPSDAASLDLYLLTADIEATLRQMP